MTMKKRTKGVLKPTLHPRNKYKGRYDLKVLVESYPVLKTFIIPNSHGVDSVDFFDPKAVKALNKALLFSDYQLDFWEFPEGFLCPPIPGRADYIHYCADLIKDKNFGRIPKGKKIKCFDLGVGANCVFPIIGASEYDWSFIGVDIDTEAIQSAQEIVNHNSSLINQVKLRLQKNKKDFFYGVLDKEDRVDLVICNPPFHCSEDDARDAASRKVSNLKGRKVEDPTLNFSGKAHELWTEGGEERFVRNMMRESKKFGENCFWFTTLISKSVHLKAALKTIEQLGAREVKMVPMGQGNKASRLIAWSFLAPKDQISWAKSRWS